MARILTLQEVQRVLPTIDVVGEIERGFAAYSAGKVDVPPVGELLFPDRHGEMHIKYGAIHGDDVFVVKIATGFFDNPARGLPPFGGCMLVLSQHTGMVEAVLLEEGELTNHRTAAAGAVAARLLAPPEVETIGICGTGVQARLQADYLRQVLSCRNLVIWGRDAARAEKAADDIAALGFKTTTAASPHHLGSQCDLIVTTTASHTPLLRGADIRRGAHVTAMGSDTPDKRELASDLIAAADLVVADSRSQCLVRGELSHAVADRSLQPERIVELGELLADPARFERRADMMTVADLTGVAVQDIQIAKAVVAKLTRPSAPGQGSN